MLLNNIDEIPEIFTFGVRCIILILRNKDGGNRNAQRNSLKRISTNTLEWKKTIIELSHFRDALYPNHRIYSSVNERNMQKSIHEFKRRQLETDFGNQHEHAQFYIDIENRFFSCLSKPNCRAQNNFIIDCDSIPQHENSLVVLPNEFILMDYQTKNGRHLVTRPFNPNDYCLIPEDAIHKDGMMYIG